MTRFSGKIFVTYLFVVLVGMIVGDLLLMRFLGDLLFTNARIINTFTAPSKTFEDIKRNAMWIAPWVLMLVASLCFSFTVGQRVGWEQVMQNNLRM